MIKVEIEGDLSNMMGGFELTDKDKNNMIRELGKEMTKEIKKRAPVVSGKLKESIKQKNTEKGFSISTNIDYAYWAEYGSGIYQLDDDGMHTGHSGWEVFPVNKKALKWTDKSGNTHFAKRVFIRGQEGQFFFKNGRAAGLTKLSKIATKYLKNVKGME